MWIPLNERIIVQLNGPGLLVNTKALSYGYDVLQLRGMTG